MSEFLELAGDGDEVSRPHEWDKAVAAAYFRALGATQAAAAEAAGIGERTLARWETCSWWDEAMRQAVERWRTDLSAASRKSLLDAVKSDGDLALKALERLDPRMSSKELTVGRVQEMLGETVRIIREELAPADAERVLARLKGVWR